MVIFKNEKISSSRVLINRLKACKSAFCIEDFSDVQKAVEMLLNYTFNGNIDDNDCLFILQEYINLLTTANHRIPYFKKYIFNVDSKFTKDLYLKWKSYKRANPYCVDYIMCRDAVSREKALETVNNLKNKTAGTKENFIKRYGKTKGLAKFKEFAAKSAHTLESFIKKYGELEGPKKYKEYLATKDVNSLAYFINKYGEHEGKIRYEANCKAIGYKNTIDYYIEKFGPEKGFIKYKEISMSKGKSGEYFISKYGEDYWNKLYKKKLALLGLGENYETLTGFDAYKKRVHRLSRKQPIWTLPNAEKQGNENNKTDPYHLDHKYSIYQCYVDNIPEYIASHIVNLEFIPMKDNLSKGIKCSITKDQLLKDYEEYENKKDNI